MDRSLYELKSKPLLKEPILIASFQGWIDAGLAASGAMAELLAQTPTEVLATFNTDELLDYRTRRPSMRITDGISDELDWPHIELRWGRHFSGQDVLLLVGPEPDFHWKAFVEIITDLVKRLGVKLAISLGAFPAPVPHTRNVKLAATASNLDLVESIGVLPGIIEVPAGIESALNERLNANKITTVGLWARVPHYVATMSFPAASIALLEGITKLSQLPIDLSDLKVMSEEANKKIDSLIENSDEHNEMVHQLEMSLDSLNSEIDISNLPSGDEIADELERFLRGEN